MQLDAYARYPGVDSGTPPSARDEWMPGVEAGAGDLSYAGRIARQNVVVGYAIRTTPPDPATSIFWVDDDARVAFIAAADRWQVCTKSLRGEVAPHAVAHLVDTLALWAYRSDLMT